MSARKELRDFAESGRLRQALEGSSLSFDAVDLAVEVIRRYCAPRSSPAQRRARLRRHAEAALRAAGRLKGENDA